MTAGEVATLSAPSTLYEWDLSLLNRSKRTPRDSSAPRQIPKPLGWRRLARTYLSSWSMRWWTSYSRSWSWTSSSRRKMSTFRLVQVKAITVTIGMYQHWILHHLLLKKIINIHACTATNETETKWSGRMAILIHKGMTKKSKLKSDLFIYVTREIQPQNVHASASIYYLV